MRYENIETLSFTDIQGKTIPIKPMREYPEYSLMARVSVTAEDKLDEIATRQNIYGDEAEGESYKIFDYNKVELFDSNFDLGKIGKLRIPL